MPIRGDQPIQHIELSKIINKTDDFDPRDIEQLSLSIASAGLLQPIILEQKPDGEFYKIIAGALRFEACKKLEWRTIPAIVRRAGSITAVAGGSLPRV